MAGRRQKGPSTEELLEKLEKRFNEFQEEHNRELADMRNGYDVSIEQCKKDCEEEIRKIREEQNETRKEFLSSINSVKVCLFSSLIKNNWKNANCFVNLVFREVEE